MERQPPRREVPISIETLRPKLFTDVSCGACDKPIYRSDTLHPEDIEMGSQLLALHYDKNRECDSKPAVWRHVKIDKSK